MEEESFPRGRPTKAPKSKVKNRVTKSEDSFGDSLFGEKFSHRKEDKGEAQSKKRKLKYEGDLLIHHGVKGNELEEREIVSVDFLRPKKLQDGMLLLGRIQEILELELVVSLPHCNTGYVQATHISSIYTSEIQRHLQLEEDAETLTPLSEMFHVGQLVVCCTLTSEKNSIQLTMAPSIINKYLTMSCLFAGQVIVGAVKSKEDHGYTVDIGKSKINAFLPSKETVGAELPKGCVVRCLVTDIRGEGSILLLTTDERKIFKSIIKKGQAMPLDSIQPGMIGSFVPQHRMKAGVVGKFLDFDASVCGLDGEVDKMSIPDDKEDDIIKRKKKHRKGNEKTFDITKKSLDKSVKCCVLYVNPLSKHVGLSTSPSLLNKEIQQKVLKDHSISFPVGHKFTVTFNKYIKGLGAVFQIDNHENVVAFCPTKHLSDARVSDPHEMFNNKKSFLARVMQNLSVNGALILSLKNSIIESKFLYYDDVTAGTVIECGVKSIRNNGVVVTLGTNLFSPIRGFVPLVHTADVTLHHPEKKFSVGDIISCKVLGVDRELKRVSLTHKRTLVKSKLPTITSYDQLKPGVITHGYIASVKSFGVFINFYNNVHGLVPNSELSTEFVENPEKAYFVGQVMKCRVIQCEAEAERAKLSFLLKPKILDESKVFSKLLEMVDVEVVGKAENGLDVLIIEGSKNRKMWHSGFIPTMHLSDFPTLANAWYCFINVGAVLKDCMIINKRKLTQLTRKKSVIASNKVVNSENCDARTEPLTFSDLKEQMVLPGFVRYIAEYGVFVQLPGGLVGLCPKAKMAERFLLSTEHYYKEGQSVTACVVEVDSEKKRFLVSLKVTDCPQDDAKSRLVDYLDEKAEIMDIICPSWPAKFIVGGRVKVELSGGENQDGSYACKNTSFPEDFSAKVIQLDETVGKNGSLNATLLSVELTEKEIILSADPTLLSSEKTKINSKVEGTVKVLNADITTVTVLNHKSSRVALTLTRSHTNHPLEVDSWPWKLGDKVEFVMSQTINEVLTVFYQDKDHVGSKIAGRGQKHRFRGDSESSDASLRGDVKFGDLEVGKEVTGVVRSIRRTCILVRFSELEHEGGYHGNPLTGRLHISEIEDDPQPGVFSLKKYHPWEKITCRVIGFRDVKTHRFLAITNRNAKRCVVELSQRSPHTNISIDDLKVGQHVVSFSNKFVQQKEKIEVELSPSVKGFIPLLLISDDPKMSLKDINNCKRPSAWNCVITDVFKHSVALAGTGALIDRESRADIPKLEDDCVANGKILKVFPKNLIVALPHGGVGKVHVTESSDVFTDQPFKNYQVGQFVRCAVVSCPSYKSLVLSLKMSRLVPKSELKLSEVKDKEVLDVKQIKPGDKLRGYIESFTKAGVFVSLSRNVTGRVNMTKMSKYYIHDTSIVQDLFYEGKLVQCKVLAISEMEGKVDLSLLECDTGCPDLIPDKLAFPLRHGKEKQTKRKAVGTLVDKVASKKKKLKQERALGNVGSKEKKRKNQVADDKDSGLDEDSSPDDSTLGACVKIVSQEEEMMDEDPGFSWGAPTSKQPSAQSTDSSSDEGHSDSDHIEEHEEVSKKAPKKKSKKEKEMDLALEEAELRQKEELLTSNKLPETAADWDRQVLASPQNSMSWVSYMAFHLRSAEVEQARAVAERAIKTIDFREDQEKWNVWAAMLNLENKFGSEDSLTSVMERASRHNDPLKVNLHMVSIYERSAKFNEAEQLCAKIVRKFRNNKNVWMLYMTHLMQRGKRDDADDVLKRSLQSLEKNCHLEVISKFGQLEYRCGDPERGRVIFENALSNYPKRSDIWSIYLDMLIKAGKTDEAREVYERVTTLNFSTKKMRTFFKRFIEFEMKYGTDDSVVEVKQKALDFVESKTNQIME